MEPKRGPVLALTLGAVGLGTLAASLTAVFLLTSSTTLRSELALPSALARQLPGACSWVAIPWAVAPVVLSLAAALVVLLSARRRGAAVVAGSLIIAMVGATAAFVGSSTTVGVVVALIVLAAFGPVTGAVHARCRRPSRTALDDLLRLTGGWLCSMALASMAVAAATPAPSPWAHACTVLPAPWPAPALLVAVQAATLGLGLIAAAAGHARRRRHDAWWARVLRGEDPEWAVVSREDLAEDELDLPALANDDLPHDGVVVRRRPGPAAGAYRTGAELEPYARVWLPVDYSR